MTHEIRGVDAKNMHIMSTNFAKWWFGNINMTSNFDVTNSANQTQMTTIFH